MELTFSAEVEAFRADFIAFLDEHLPDELAAAQRSRSTSHLPALGASVAAPAVRPRLAVAGQSAGIRRPRCRRSAAVRVPGRTLPAAYLPFVQPAGRRDHRGLPADLRHRRAEAALGGADSASRADGVAGHERAGGGFGPGGTAQQGGAPRRPLRGQWTQAVDLRRHDADVLLTFVRTDPDAPKHRGISALLIARDTPGVLCRPFPSATPRQLSTSTKCS